MTRACSGALATVGCIVLAAAPVALGTGAADRAAPWNDKHCCRRQFTGGERLGMPAGDAPGVTPGVVVKLGEPSGCIDGDDTGRRRALRDKLRDGEQP